MSKIMSAVFSGIGATNATILGISLTQCYTIVGLILFILQICVLVGTWIYKLVKYIKNDGKLDENELQDLVNDGKEIAEKIEETSEKVNKQ